MVKYVIYSRTQHQIRTDTERKLNRLFTPGKIFIKGVPTNFTSIVNSLDGIPDDAIVIYSADSQEFKNLHIINPCVTPMLHQ